jgi:hypothetical protein
MEVCPSAQPILPNNPHSHIDPTWPHSERLSHTTTDSRKLWIKTQRSGD